MIDSINNYRLFLESQKGLQSQTGGSKSLKELDKFKSILNSGNPLSESSPTSDMGEMSILSDALNLDVLLTLSKIKHQPSNRHYSGTGSQGMSKIRTDESSESEFFANLNSDKILDSSVKSDSAELGKISKLFESADMGAGAIGFDQNGGTSYGTYQISSAQGSMDHFLDYLQEVKPEWADRLRKSGSSNTGSTEGRFPQEWKQIAGENKAELEKMEAAFIRKTHFQPALERLVSGNFVQENDLNPALQEALFSTSVQHGPKGAFQIFSEALREMSVSSETGRKGSDGLNSLDSESLLALIYRERGTKFSGSTPAVREAVQERLTRELETLLTMNSSSDLA